MAASVTYANLVSNAPESDVISRRARAKFLDSILFEHELVDIAPHPVFTRFKRANDGVFNGVEMFCGVLIF